MRSPTFHTAVLFCVLLRFVVIGHAQSGSYPPPPLVDGSVAFGEVNGLVAVEAEHFSRQSQNGVRAWYINSPRHRPHVQPDYDDASFLDAGGLAYVEALPDRFHTDLDPIIPGHSLGTVGGTVAVLHYPIHFSKPGTYYLWTRLRSNDEEDNTIQAGIDGTWPETAKILQSPVNKKEWIWKNDNRLSRTPWKIGRAMLEVPSAGVHDVQFCMREDGEEFDRFILTSDPNFTIAEGIGPAETLKQGQLPMPFSAEQAREPSIRRIVNPDGSIYGANVLYEMTDGKLAIEAEDFYMQSRAHTRAWHLTSAELTPMIGPDSDPPRLEGASGNAYLELLPDVRQKDEDAMHSKSSILGEGGQGAVLSHMVRFAEPGTYFVWVRARANDGDDNTLHVGVDNTWPQSGKKLTFQGKQWNWSNTQRDTKAPISIEIPTAGIHELQISMREDGCELDRICLSSRGDFVPSDHSPPPTTIKKGQIESWYKNRTTLMSTERSFLETQGFVLIESESVPATQGWKYIVDGQGHAGLGYLEWIPTGQGIKPGTGLLTYNFTISQPGNYQLLLRGRIKDPTNRPETLDPDSNDIWVKISGGNNVTGQTPLKEDWNKIAILGHPAGWTWNTHVDVEQAHPNSPVCRHFEKGNYLLSLSGRSQGYTIDRFAFVRYSVQPIVDFDSAAQLLATQPESAAHFQAK